MTEWGYDNDNPETNGEYRVIRDWVSPTSVVVDVGANRGDWTHQVLTSVPDFKGHIYMFEPVPTLATALRDRYGSDARTSLSDRGLWSSPLNKAFYFSPHVTPMSSLYNRPCFQNVGGTIEVPVQLTTLDLWRKEQALPYIDFLKIDVEGAEVPVLEGASETLSAQQVGVVQFEYGGTYSDAGHTLQKAWSLLQGHGYRVSRITASGLLNLDHWDPAWENYRYSNYLAVSPRHSTVQ